MLLQHASESASMLSEQIQLLPRLTTFRRLVQHRRTHPTTTLTEIEVAHFEPSTMTPKPKTQLFHSGL